MTTLELNQHVRYELAKLGLWDAICRRNPQLALFDALEGVGLTRADGSSAASPTASSASSFTAFPPEARDGALDTTTTEGGANLPLETRAALQKGA